MEGSAPDFSNNGPFVTPRREPSLKRSSAALGASLLSSMNQADRVQILDGEDEEGPLGTDMLDEDMMEEDSQEEDLPDLDDFFNEYEYPLKERIALCRAYASYLSAKLPRTKK